MDIPKLHIETTKGILGLSTTRPIQRIEQAAASLSIEQPKAIQTFQTTQSKLSIDSTQARADVDLKSIAKRWEEVASYSRQSLLEGMGSRAQQGTEMMSIENGGNSIASQAKQIGRQMKNLGIKFIPSYGSVKIEFTPGKIDIQTEQQKPIISSQANKPIHDYTPGKVTAEMIQYPSIDISW
ncbi:MAG: DUF6470 family protein [Paenisporosarcina sp.]